jgi:hypothetical protein
MLIKSVIRKQQWFVLINFRYKECTQDIIFMDAHTVSPILLFYFSTIYHTIREAMLEEVTGTFLYFSNYYICLIQILRHYFKMQPHDRICGSLMFIQCDVTYIRVCIRIFNNAHYFFIIFFMQNIQNYINILLYFFYFILKFFKNKWSIQIL